MSEETLARRLFKEQIRKELLNEIKQYVVGKVWDGEMIVTKGGEWDGFILVIPNKKYQEFFQ